MVFWLARRDASEYEHCVTTAGEDVTGTGPAAAGLAETRLAATRLDKWLDEGPRTWRDVVTVFLDVGHKIEASHGSGVIHEEVRIENVFVLPDGHGDVRDLKPAVQNVAKVGPGSVPSPAVSLEQRLAEMKSTESVAFLAPEQFRGRSADARANQFSFCVALYRALYRQSPFDHEWAVSQAGESRRTPLGSIHFDLLIQSFDRATLINLAREVLSGNLRPPPEETDVPVWLDQIVRRGLQTDPEERYPSLRHLLAEIEKDFREPAQGKTGLRLPRAALAAGAALLVLALGALALSLSR
jgi:serine/threonine protein kinase